MGQPGQHGLILQVLAQMLDALGEVIVHCLLGEPGMQHDFFGGIALVIFHVNNPPKPGRQFFIGFGNAVDHGFICFQLFNDLLPGRDIEGFYIADGLPVFLAAVQVYQPAFECRYQISLRVLYLFCCNILLQQVKEKGLYNIFRFLPAIAKITGNSLQFCSVIGIPGMDKTHVRLWLYGQRKLVDHHNRDALLQPFMFLTVCTGYEIYGS